MTSKVTELQDEDEKISLKDGEDFGKKKNLIKHFNANNVIHSSLICF